MTERWRTELDKLRPGELPADLWGRIGEGPQLEPLGLTPRSRVAAAVAAFAVFAVAAVLVWRVFAPIGEEEDLDRRWRTDAVGRGRGRGAPARRRGPGVPHRRASGLRRPPRGRHGVCG